MSCQLRIVRRKRKGFTLIEMLVVIAIIGVLVALLLPAVQKAREAAARTQCVNNMRQMGIGMHNHYDQTRKFPSSGEGVDPALGTTAFDMHSMFTLILPYIEHNDVYEQFDLDYVYNDSTNAPGNVVAAKQAIPEYLCPSNPWRPSSGRDSLGYGYCDYMPIAYTDIDAAAASGTPIRNATWPTNKSIGGMKLGGSNMGDIRDGTSKTIAVMEDVGRSETYFTPKYTSPVNYQLLPSGSDKRNGWRWAEPDTANGVSGPPGAQFGDSKLVLINNNPQPAGGPTGCPWTTNNCGPNDEPFSLHGNGCNTLFFDGHVSFLPNNIDPLVLRRLLTPAEGLPIADSNGNSYVDY